MEFIFSWVESFAENALLLFFSVFFLSLIHTFLPPLPLEGITVFSSYIASKCPSSSLTIWTATTIGMSIGNTLMYYLAKSQGERILNWRFIKNQLPQKYIDKARSLFQRFGVLTMFIGKFITGMSFVVVFCCGLFKIKSKTALCAIFFSNLIYYGVLVYFGKYLGLKWGSVTQYKGRYILIAISCVVIIILGVLIFKRFKQRVSQRKKLLK